MMMVECDRHQLAEHGSSAFKLRDLNFVIVCHLIAMSATYCQLTQTEIKRVQYGY